MVRVQLRSTTQLREDQTFPTKNSVPHPFSHVTLIFLSSCHSLPSQLPNNIPSWRWIRLTRPYVLWFIALILTINNITSIILMLKVFSYQWSMIVRFYLQQFVVKEMYYEKEMEWQENIKWNNIGLKEVRGTVTVVWRNWNLGSVYWNTEHSLDGENWS